MHRATASLDHRHAHRAALVAYLAVTSSLVSIFAGPAGAQRSADLQSAAWVASADTESPSASPQQSLEGEIGRRRNPGAHALGYAVPVPAVPNACRGLERRLLGAAVGTAIGALAGLTSFTFGIGALAADHGAVYRSERRKWVRAGAVLGAVAMAVFPPCPESRRAPPA